MAWTSMHFLVGMGCTGAVIGLGCLVTHRGWRWLTPGMTLGGVLACLPDATRLFTEDFPNAPLAGLLGSPKLRDWLHAHADWFFFHGTLDSQPKEYALHGLLGIVVLYHLAWGLQTLTSLRPRGWGRSTARPHQPLEPDARPSQTRDIRRAA